MLGRARNAEWLGGGAGSSGSQNCHYSYIASSSGIFSDGYTALARPPAAASTRTVIRSRLDCSRQGATQPRADLAASEG